MQKSVDVRRLWERALIEALMGSAVTGSGGIGGGAARRANREKQAVREQRLEPFIASRQFVIETRDQGRRITCEYERTVEALGGKKTLRFKNEVDESFS